MKTLINQLKLALGILVTTAIMVTSCSKDADISNTAPATLKAAAAAIDEGFVNRLLVVQRATDDGADITANFAGITFRFVKTSPYGGIAQASNDLLAVEGKWFTDETSELITFQYPTDIIPALAFMNKQWRFTTNSSTMIELVAANGENDMVRFVDK